MGKRGEAVNYFILVGGGLWLGAAVQAYINGNYRMMVVAIAYAVSQFALTGAK